MICRCIEAAASHKEQSPRFAPISIAWTLKSRTPPADLLAGLRRILAIAHGSWWQAACALVRCKRRARVCTTRRIDSWWLSGLGDRVIQDDTGWYEIIRASKITQARLTNWWLRSCMWKSMPAGRCNMALSALVRSQIPIPWRERQRADSWFWHRSACQRFQPQTSQPKTLQTTVDAWVAISDDLGMKTIAPHHNKPSTPIQKRWASPVISTVGAHWSLNPKSDCWQQRKRNTAHRHEPWHV